MIDTCRRIILVKIPKTASSSLLDALLEPLGRSLEDVPRPPIINVNLVANFAISARFRVPGRPKRYNGWHVSARDCKRYLGDDFDGYQSVTVVRNPFDRIVSNFEFQRGKQRSVGTFDEFVRGVCHDLESMHPQVQLHAIPQVEWITDRRGAVLVDSILRYERLDSDFERWCADVGLEAIPLGDRNRSSRRPTPEYFTRSETIERVLDYYTRDFVRLGYSTDPTVDAGG